MSDQAAQPATVTGGVFEYDGYRIPLDLVTLTGGGPDTWDSISRGHMAEYAEYMPISPGHRVLEVGCGVGRDAIQLSHLLDSSGSYVGVDIIEPSIAWCRENIGRRHPNFRFIHFDVQSQIHNANGRLRVDEVRMPVADGSIDRVILQSVFTHMFEPDITHYLREFSRILAPDGLVFASIFLIDEETLALAEATGQWLTFRHRRAPDCRINDPQYPEGAVAYNEAAVQRMLDASAMRLVQPIHRGFWSGREGVSDGQDICIIGRA